MAHSRIRLITVMLVVLGGFSIANAQNFKLRSIFRPRLTFGYEDTPTLALNDSVDFRGNEISFGATIPLRLKVDAKRLRPGVKADFLLLDAGYRNSYLAGLEPPHSLFRASFGLSGIRARIGSGAWFYTVNGGISADLTEPDKNFPYLVGAFGRIKIKALKRQNLYGVGLFLGRDVILPIPVIGFNRIYSLKSGLIALVPLYVNYWRTLSSKVSFSGTFSIGGFNNAWTPLSGSRLRLNSAAPVTLQVNHARLAARFSFDILPKLSLYLEGGSDVVKLVRFVQEDESIYRELLPFQPFGKAGITWKIPRKESKWYIPEF